MDLKNGVCIVTGSATGIGAACGWSSPDAAVARSSTTPRAKPKRNRPRGLREGRRGNRRWCARTSPRMRTAGAWPMPRWRSGDASTGWSTTPARPRSRSITPISTRSMPATSREIYAVNVVGAFQMIRAVEPAMRKQGKGAVVNVSSIAAVTGDRHLGRLRGVEGRAEHHDSVAGPRARTADPRECRLSGLRGNTLAARRDRRALRTARSRSLRNSPLQRTCTPEDVATRSVVARGRGSRDRRIHHHRRRQPPRRRADEGESRKRSSHKEQKERA